MLKQKSRSKEIGWFESVSIGKEYFAKHLIKNNYDEETKKGDCTRNNPDKIDKLSNQEKLVLKFMGKACNCNEIATKMGISKRTVETYKANIKTKLEFKKNAELVIYSFKNSIFL